MSPHPVSFAVEYSTLQIGDSVRFFFSYPTEVVDENEDTLQIDEGISLVVSSGVLKARMDTLDNDSLVVRYSRRLLTGDDEMFFDRRVIKGKQLGYDSFEAERVGQSWQVELLYIPRKDTAYFLQPYISQFSSTSLAVEEGICYEGDGDLGCSLFVEENQFNRIRDFLPDVQDSTALFGFIVKQ
ncbi:MAG: hypothetical protein AAFV95_25405 [Bacteroidota bacterium]